jgi:alkylation response protein AidB-like acyl-CoA dehydrogenase
MDTMYRLDPDQLAIVERARRLADDEVAPHAAEVDEQARFPSEAVDALGRAGLLGLTVPTDHGGLGQGLRAAVAVLDEVSQRCPSTGMVYLMHLCAVACYGAARELAADELRAAARGEHLGTLAWSERGSRSHFWAPVSRARAENGHVTLSAEKSFVTSAGIADGYVVASGAAGSEEPLATTLYLVRRDDPGLQVDGPWASLGLRGNASAPMRLEGVRLPSGRALSADGKGFDTMIGVVLPVFQLGNAAISVGIAEAAVRATTAHLTAQRFEHLGTRLADLPNLRARLAQMRIETDKARAHLGHAVDAAEAGAPEAMLMVLEAKASAAEAAVAVTDLGMRACGGAAFGKQLGLERYFRDARAAGVMAPTTDVLHDFIGRALCGMELF